MKLYTFRATDDKQFPIEIISHGKFDVCKIAVNASVMEVMTILEALNGHKTSLGIVDAGDDDIHISFTATPDLKSIYVEEGEHPLAHTKIMRKWALDMYTDMSATERWRDFGLTDFFPGNSESDLIFRAEFAAPQTEDFYEGKKTDLEKMLDDVRRTIRATKESD